MELVAQISRTQNSMPVFFTRTLLGIPLPLETCLITLYTGDER